jgi:hypothetical protein
MQGNYQCLMAMLSIPTYIAWLGGATRSLYYMFGFKGGPRMRKLSCLQTNVSDLHGWCTWAGAIHIQGNHHCLLGLKGVPRGARTCCLQTTVSEFLGWCKSWADSIHMQGNHPCLVAMLSIPYYIDWLGGAAH